jgi:hypothetical protein
MVCIGKHWRLPKRTDDKQWKILRRRIEQALARGLSPTWNL